MGIVGSLSPDQLEFFNTQGYLVIESFSSPEEIDGMRKRMEILLDEFDPSGISIFSTKNQRRTTDNHFYDSAEKVSFFFEGSEEAWILNLFTAPEQKVGGVVSQLLYLLVISVVSKGIVRSSSQLLLISQIIIYLLNLWSCKRIVRTLY